MDLKLFALKHARVISRIPFNNYLFKNGNKVLLNKSLLFRCTVCCSGVGNIIEIQDGTILFKSRITIRGNYNNVFIGKNSSIKYTHINLEDNNNKVSIGDNTYLCGATNIGCIESTKISIGNNCLFSSGIEIRSGDSHSIYDCSGKRMNESKNITIGNHVWLCHGVSVLKGVDIADDIVVGAGSIVIKSLLENHCVAVGSPAYVIKNNIIWDRKRTAQYDK